MLQSFPRPQWELTARLTNEFRYHFVPENTDFTWHEVFVDLLYLKWDSVGGTPISLKLGRQEITFGEWFIFAEGTPLDGSRSIYFNAARVDATMGKGHTLTLVYVDQPEQDKYLPLIHDQYARLLEQEERAIVAHLSGAWRKVGWQAYYIYKHARNNGASLPERGIHAPGLHLQTPLSAQLTAVVEAAAQFGTVGDEDHRAIGGYAYGEYRTGWPEKLPRAFAAGMIHLSGDDFTTAKDEGWDPLFGRWPKWSESYIYTLTRERGVAYWTNLSSFFARTAIPISPDLLLALDYHHLTAPEHGAPTRAFPGGAGNVRGDLVIAKLSYQLTPHLSGHMQWERFEPGEFYFDGADGYGWARFEMMLKF
jgi:hypothetical protein